MNFATYKQHNKNLTVYFYYKLFRWSECMCIHYHTATSRSFMLVDATYICEQESGDWDRHCFVSFSALDTLFMSSTLSAIFNLTNFSFSFFLFRYISQPIYNLILSPLILGFWSLPLSLLTRDYNMLECFSPAQFLQHCFASYFFFIPGDCVHKKCNWAVVFLRDAIYVFWFLSSCCCCHGFPH